MSTPTDPQTLSTSHFVPLFPIANTSDIEPAPSLASACRVSKKRRCKSSQRPPSASATTESTQESTHPTCSVSTTDKEDANAVSVSNATSYGDETDQMRPYDRDSDVATTQDARESLNDGADSNVRRWWLSRYRSIKGFHQGTFFATEQWPRRRRLTLRFCIRKTWWRTASDNHNTEGTSQVLLSGLHIPFECQTSPWRPTMALQRTTSQMRWNCYYRRLNEKSTANRFTQSRCRQLDSTGRRGSSEDEETRSWDQGEDAGHHGADSQTPSRRS